MNWLLQNWDTWYWPAWLLIGFGIPEIYALYRLLRYNDEGHTLSENVRIWFATDLTNKNKLDAWSKIRRIALVCGMAWLAFHWINPGTFF